MLSASEKDTGIDGKTEVDKGRVGIDIRTIVEEVRNNLGVTVVDLDPCHHIMTSTALTVNQVMGNAVEEMEVGDEKLSINKVYMWQNNMPRVTRGPSDQNRRNGQHITVHIKRERTRPDSAELASTPPVVVTKLHVVQTSSVDNLTSFSASSTASGEGSNYYSWDMPVASADATPQAGAVEESTARREHLAMIRPAGWRGIPDEIEVQAWDGPDWGGGKDFVTLVEFEGGLVLRSDVQTADIVS